MKTIGVLTSGGDAPGMNAAVRAVVRAGCENGFRVMGIRRGYNGLMQGDMFEMNLRSVSNIINRGGTVLYSARSPEFKTEEGLQKALKVAKDVNMEGIVVIGGDGSFRGARDLSLRGVNCVGIPGTIDNDIACSDYTIGYDTAMNTVLEMVDRLRDTSESHDRCSVVEVMGRRAGFIALNAGIAVGATCILIPEVDYDIDSYIIERMKRTQKTGKEHFVIVVAEGVKGIDSASLAKYIEQKTGVESRATVLGHVQRGGSPNVMDRVMASRMGAKAVDLLLEGKQNRVICVENGKIIDRDIEEGLAMKKELPIELMGLVKKLSV